MRLSLTTVIFGYMFICVALLLYNIFYIFHSQGRSRRQIRDAAQWERAVTRQIESLEEVGMVSRGHRRLMLSQLGKVQALMAYDDAIQTLRERLGAEAVWRYLLYSEEAFQELALVYSKKSSMERAYYAYLMSSYRPCHGSEYRQLMELLLGYLPDSTIYCRENVLNALYALGNPLAVENALQILNDRQWFHHIKLLADGLMTYTGDKEALAWRLWRHHEQWNPDLMVAVVQFITSFSAEFREAFWQPVQDQKGNLEIRLAILRYYRRYPYEPVRALLYQYLESPETKETPLAIVSAAVLASYPGPETVAVLKGALHSRNWYVRYDAADSLGALGVADEQLRDIFEGEDRYAREMLTYMRQNAKAGVPV